MKDQRKSEIKVGITVFVSIIGLLWVLSWVKDFSIYDERQQYKVVFDTVAGLSEGDAVTIRGVKKGIIESIALTGEGAIATLYVDSEIEIYSDATFSVMMLDLMGGKKIEVNPGTSGVPINTEIMHKGKFLGDISVAMASLSSVQDDLVDVIKQIKLALNQLNSNYLDEEFNSELKSVLYGFKTLTDNMNKMIVKNDEALNDLITSGNVVAEKTIKLLDDNEKVVNTTLNNLNELIVHSDSLVVKMDNFSREVKSQENNIGKMIYDDKMYDDLVIIIGQLKELTEILIQQLKNEGVNVNADVF
jgi:phospholipid/cholesterol/gamma-HCH transport system substrate-binding protein